jgi:hypothetical protein
VFARWTWGKPAAAVIESLAAAGAGGADAGWVAVLEAAPLARLLADKGRRVVPFARSDRGLKRWPGPAARAARGALPVADGALAALVATGGRTREGDWPALYQEWSRAVREGGLVIVVDSTPPDDQTRRALCAGLIELEQREAGGLTVTSGRVRKI